jgi:hypothetical protein
MSGPVTTQRLKNRIYSFALGMAGFYIYLVNMTIIL